MLNANLSQNGESGLNVTDLTGANLGEVVGKLIGTVQDLKGKVAAHEGLLMKLDSLVKENNQLRSTLAEQNQEILRLRGLLSSPAAARPSDVITPSTSSKKSRAQYQPMDTPYGHPKNDGFESREQVTCHVLNSDTQLDPESTWATIARRVPNVSRQAPSARKFAAASRAFSLADPAAAKGFDYVYLPRKRKFTRTEIRVHLRRLGIDPSRILDISFPARSCVGLLVHAQCVPDLVSALNPAKVSLLQDFEPLDPVHLGNSIYKDDSVTVRTQKMASIHFDRCVDTLKHIRPHLVLPVGSMFVAKGWIDNEAVEKAVEASFPFGNKSKRSRPSPDNEMDDVFSLASDKNLDQ